MSEDTNMSTKSDSNEQVVDDKKVDAVDQTDTGNDENNVDFWKQKAAEAEAEAAKNRNIRKKLEKERDAAKKAKQEPSESDQDYKALWQQETAARAKILEKARTADVRTAATARLTKLGVISDGLDAALKLIDPSKIEWDEDGGVDETSVQAGVQLLKSQYPFLFEKKVSSTTVKTPSEGKTGAGDNEITRSEFDKLGFKDRAAKIAKGVRVVD
jgi:hypothetical protein